MMDGVAQRLMVMAYGLKGLFLAGTIVFITASTPDLELAAQQPPIVQARPTKLTTTEARQLQQLFTRQSPARSVVLNHAFRVNVSTFGSCLFAPVVDRSRGAAKLSLHLVKNDRIVYTFPQPNWTQPWSLRNLKAVGFMELNFDGGDGDIVLISEYTAGASGAGASPTFPVVLVFLTEEQGYELDDTISQILTKRKVSTIAQAETIMRQEFHYLP